MEIGDIVAPNKQGVYLRSGAEAWHQAIVCSIEPFIMVSEDTTMRWGAQQIEYYATVGKATPEALQACISRLGQDEKQKVEEWLKK